LRVVAGIGLTGSNSGSTSIFCAAVAGAMSVMDSDMGSSSGRNEWLKILVRQVFFLFASGYPPPTGLDHRAYQEEAALLIPIAHRSKLTESRLPPFSQPRIKSASLEFPLNFNRP
jgi:hypothetical protein